MTHSALILDDEPDIRELLELTLNRMNIKCHLAANLKESFALLKKHNFDICLTDMKLPDGEGIELVEHLQKNYPNVPCAVITAFGNTEMAVRSLKAGAFDFISKPVDLTNLRDLVSTALRLEDASHIPQPERDELIGQSEAVNHIRNMIEKLARSQAPVHISGESGTGKELVARTIHNGSPRQDQPFIAVNCGAIPSELMESELFGHTRGSFTGADRDKKGLFEMADGGTLFLDEIAELPMHMQVKLLRVIQERAVRPIGGEHEKHIDVRILSATNKDLKKLVSQEKFRDDLYFRLNVIELPLPPLRERKQDIDLLTNKLLSRWSANNQTVYHMTPEARKIISEYDFPGNIRELENILERAVALSNEGRIEATDLQLHTASIGSMQTAGENLASGSIPDRGDLPLETYLATIERGEILAVLEATRWNRSDTARRLGLSARQLRYKMSKLGINE